MAEQGEDAQNCGAGDGEMGALGFPGGEAAIRWLIGETWPSRGLSSSVSRRRHEGGGRMCARLEEEERERRMTCVARREKEEKRFARGLRGRKEGGDGPRGKEKEPSCWRVFLCFFI